MKAIQRGQPQEIIDQHKINKEDLFIKGYYMNSKFMDNLINFFELNKKLHFKGKMGNNEVRPKDKKSTEIFLDDQNPFASIYIKSLMGILDEYLKTFVYADKHQPPFKIREYIKLQKYKPNEGFYTWHFENGLLRNRHLVFMTYLNDVKNGGTEFLYQKTKIEAEKGLTLIWPADWTHTHRGVVSKKETKYIVTGWFNCYQDPSLL